MMIGRFFDRFFIASLLIVAAATSLPTYAASPNGFGQRVPVDLTRDSTEFKIQVSGKPGEVFRVTPCNITQTESGEIKQKRGGKTHQVLQFEKMDYQLPESGNLAVAGLIPNTAVAGCVLIEEPPTVKKEKRKSRLSASKVDLKMGIGKATAYSIVLEFPEGKDLADFSVEGVSFSPSPPTKDRPTVATLKLGLSHSGLASLRVKEAQVEIRDAKKRLVETVSLKPRDGIFGGRIFSVPVLPKQYAKQVNFYAPITSTRYQPGRHDLYGLIRLKSGEMRVFTGEFTVTKSSLAKIRSLTTLTSVGMAVYGEKGRTAYRSDAKTPVIAELSSSGRGAAEVLLANNSLEDAEGEISIASGRKDLAISVSRPKFRLRALSEKEIRIRVAGKEVDQPTKVPAKILIRGTDGTVLYRQKFMVQVIPKQKLEIRGSRGTK